MERIDFETRLDYFLYPSSGVLFGFTTAGARWPVAGVRLRARVDWKPSESYFGLDAGSILYFLNKNLKVLFNY